MSRKSFQLALVVVQVLSLQLLALILPVPGTAQQRSDNIDVILIVDNSGSMAENDPDKFRISAAKLFVDLSQDGDRIGLVNLASKQRTEVVAPLTKISPWLDQTLLGREELKEKLEANSKPQGATLMGTALRHAYNMLHETAPGRRQFVVMLTDGQPEGEQPEILTEVLRDFRHKRFWTIFPIALGDTPDMDLLSKEMADPTGGLAFKAATPVDLIRIYTQIFAMMRYNRYVDWVTVQPNILQELASIDPDQKVQNLAFVIPRNTWDDPFVDVLVSPNDVNIVDPGLAGSVYRAEDPRYEVFVMENDHVLLDGLWRARFLSEGRVEVAILVHSAYGIQVSKPPAQESWNELSPRYVPVGKELFLELGVRDSSASLSPIPDPRSLYGELTPLQAPVVQMVKPAWDPLVLRDDGLLQDEQRDDGLYTGIYGMMAEPGLYRLHLQVPGRKDDAVRLTKVRYIEARSLPYVSLVVPESQPLAPGMPLVAQLVVHQPEGLGAKITDAKIGVYLKAPDGKTSSLQALPQDDETITVDFAPTVEGPHDLVVITDFRVMQPEGEIAYSDLAYGTYNAIFPERSLSLSGSQIDLGSMDQFHNTALTIEVTSDSSQSEQLLVRVEGLPGGTVLPNALEIPPNATTAFELTVGSTSTSEAGANSFQLVFSSPDPALRLNNSILTYHYRIAYVLEVSAVDSVLEEQENPDDIKATISVWSDAPVEQVLNAEMISPAGAAIWPSTVRVPPREETNFTFSIHLPEGAETEGRFRILLTAENDAVAVLNGALSFEYQLRSGFPGRYVCIPSIMLVVAFVGFFFWRRSRRSKEKRR